MKIFLHIEIVSICATFYSPAGALHDFTSMSDGMENSEIFRTMKRQWNILITGS
jgi:hypothetical protein